ncbi:UNVERIFIED_CONTAM: hypothetical protein HDU68_002988 [Siphonaria sp. JEL0065]|nr:hypothetical protein HDU68_002988 [Siphonaria sp. JEL0065]
MTLATTKHTHQKEEAPQFLVAVRAPTPETDLESANEGTLVEHRITPSPPPLSSTDADDADNISLDSISKSKTEHQLKQSKAWEDLVRFKYSILPFLGSQLVVVVVWATIVCVFYKVDNINFLNGLPNSITYTVVLGTSVSLLLAFRTNTAYDRFWEGRRMWGLMKYQMINLSRLIQITIKTKTPEDVIAKDQALDLIYALALATKHHLRDEFTYPDISPIISLNEPLKSLPPNSHMPLHIMTQIQAYIVNTKQLTNPLCQTITGISDIISSLERIHSTPIPQAYACHMQQILAFYLAALPFQIVPSTGWVAILITLLAAYIMLGLRMIAQKIEDPFGHDAQDLPVDFYCEELKAWILHIQKREESGSTLGWLKPHDLGERKEKHKKRV